MSLRTRLLLAVGAVALVALAIAGVATYSSLHSFLNSQVDQTLEVDHAPLEHALVRGQPLRATTVGRLAPGAFVAVRGPEGETLGSVASIRPGGTPSVPALPASVAIPGHTPGPGEPHVFFTTHAVDHNGPRFRVRASVLPGGDQLILALPLGTTATTLHRLALVEGVVAALALGVAIVLGWFLVRTGLGPLREMEATAGAIASGDLTSRVPEAGARTEVGHLARAFNAMLDRIQGAFAERDATEAELRASEDRLRRFVADASHELRTPVAAVSAYAELFERG
ncbi:MAG TPA: HAMP domain-containing protein, partial [Acidimicrobiales bacterium]|nr:HAMP domain-containing protein [Acidimicrobiales bacterium]